MNADLRKTLETVRQQVTEATEGHEWDDQAEFFGELADWAYGRYEILSGLPEPELQDYEEEDNDY